MITSGRPILRLVVFLGVKAGNYHGRCGCSTQKRSTGPTGCRSLPILWASGIGSDVMKPIAAPMVGGMITSTIHVLILVPVFFVLMKERDSVDLLSGQPTCGGCIVVEL